MSVPFTIAVCERFKQLVPIANPSGGEAEIRALLAKTLAELGCTDQHIDAAGNLLVRVPGISDRLPILLSAHMDSVPPCHGIEAVEATHPENGRPILRSAGNTILGADDKSGMAVILDIVANLAQANFQQNTPLELFFSVEEEVGVKGSKAFDMTQLKAPYGFVLDGEGSVGDIFNAGPSQVLLEVTCHGRPAHAGISPEEGVNAIAMAARLIAQLPTGRLDAKLTSNIGVIEGGKAMNVVPDHVLFKADARSHDEALLQGLLATYQKACTSVEETFPGSRVEWVSMRRYEAFHVDAHHRSVQHAQTACETLGLPTRLLPMNIGSDAHELNRAGLPTVVLGMGFHRSHSLGEFIYMDELEQVVQWVLAIVNAA